MTSVNNKTSAHSKPDGKNIGKRTGSIGQSIRGFIIIVLSLYLLTCFIFPMGDVGVWIRKIFFGILGPVASALFALVTAFMMYRERKLRENGVFVRKFIFFLTASFVISMAVHLIAVGESSSEHSGKWIAFLFENGQVSLGGGVLVGAFAWLICNIIGFGGSIALFSAAALLLLSFAIGDSGAGAWSFAADFFCIERAPKEKASSAPVEYPDISDISASSVKTDIASAPSGKDTASVDGAVFGGSAEVSADLGADKKQRTLTAPALYAKEEPAEVNESSDDDDEDSDPFADDKKKKDKQAKKEKKLKGAKKPKGASDGGSSPDLGGDGDGGEDGVKRWETGDKYLYPSTELLNNVVAKKAISESEVKAVADKILRKLASFKVSASLVGYSIGPSITRYELAPGEGVRVSKISQLITDISLELASEGVRIEAPIPGKAAVGIEVPNKKVSIVSFRSLAESPEFMKAKSKITVCVGQSVTGDPVFMDIDEMPHVLIAGQTKSGKSVAINCMLLSLLFRVTPDEVKLILIDPKRVELNIYGRLPHLVAPVVDDPTKAAAVLSWAVKEMERRYDLMEKFGARNRDEYRKNTASISGREDFPQIVIVIDELADLMLQVREHVEPLINRLAAKARACGIHLLIGTQRPSVDVLTGLIKANIPARISFKVAEQVDSRTIIGTVGAEKLLGRGDMLYQPTGGARVRVQGAYVDGEEINRIVDYIVERNGEASYDPDVIAQIDEEAKSMLHVKKRGGAAEDDEPEREKKLDPLFYNAVEVAVQNQSISTSSLQRFLEVGYGRAAKLIDTMEKMGIAGPPNGSKPREVFMTMDQYQVWRLEQRFD